MYASPRVGTESFRCHRVAVFCPEIRSAVPSIVFAVVAGFPVESLVFLQCGSDRVPGVESPS
jgi:hypothetical protein